MALGKKYPDVSLEDVLFKKFQPNHFTYKMKAWKTRDAEGTAVVIVDVRD